jgi:hypothetical protein
LPDGIVVAADPTTGEVTADSVTISGAAAVGTNKLIVAKVTPSSATAPASLSLSLINAAGFGIGECVTIRFTMAPGAHFPAGPASFSVTGVTAKGTDGLALNGITAAPTFLSGL